MIRSWPFLCYKQGMLRIPRPLYAEIIEHLQAVYPEEGCGLLAGIEEQVFTSYPIENILHSQTAFEMDPLQQVKTMLTIENEGKELLAIYHSHPQGPSLPSETDIAQAYYPDTINIIVSLIHESAPSLRGFYIVAGTVSEVLIMVE